MTALQQHLGRDLRTADAIVGTSAGSVLASLVAAGVPVADLRRHQAGPVTAGLLGGFEWDHDTATGPDRPPRPRPGVGSPRLLAHNIAHLRRLPPTAVLSALLPEGRGSLESVGALVRHVVPSGWVDRPGLQVVTMDFETGQRVAFGRPGAPPADLADAVMASCAIPGWYAPVRIGSDRYVDGGACSATSVDLLAGLGLDEVFVLAPSIAFAVDHPADVHSRLERQWRARATRRCLHEVAKVHAGGSEVTVVGPGPEDLVVIGANLMDVGRRRAVLETSLRTSAVALTDAIPFESIGPAARTDPVDRADASVVPRQGRALAAAGAPAGGPRPARPSRPRAAPAPDEPVAATAVSATTSSRLRPARTTTPTAAARPAPGSRSTDARVRRHHHGRPDPAARRRVAAPARRVRGHPRPARVVHRGRRGGARVRGRLRRGAGLAAAARRRRSSPSPEPDVGRRADRRAPAAPGGARGRGAGRRGRHPRARPARRRPLGSRAWRAASPATTW
nr:patatin-like phospholipase family protein [Angustibacter aerolatus]